MRCLKASAPEVGSNYNKADTLAGNLLRQIKTAIEMTRPIRVVMSACPETIKNKDGTNRCVEKLRGNGMETSTGSRPTREETQP